MDDYAKVLRRLEALEYHFRAIVPGEPSLGTPHPFSDANRSTTALVSTSTNTAGIWSAAVTVSSAPQGTTAVWCLCSISKSSVYPILCVEAATGFILSDITVGTNYYKYWSVACFPTAAIDKGWGIVRIHLDSNKQFKWCTTISSSTVTIGPPVAYDT